MLKNMSVGIKTGKKTMINCRNLGIASSFRVGLIHSIKITSLMANSTNIYVHFVYHNVGS